MLSLNTNRDNDNHHMTLAPHLNLVKHRHLSPTTYPEQFHRMLLLHSYNWKRFLIQKLSCSASQKIPHSVWSLRIQRCLAAHISQHYTSQLRMHEPFCTTDNVIMYVALPLYIQEVLSLDLSPKTSYPKCFCTPLQSLPANAKLVLKSGPDNKM
jgi:hypothetical protein